MPVIWHFKGLMFISLIRLWKVFKARVEFLRHLVKRVGCYWRRWGAIV